MESWWEAPGAASSRRRAACGPRAAPGDADSTPWPGPRRGPNRGGWGKRCSKGTPYRVPGRFGGTRPRACAASAVPGTGVLLCFLKTGTSLLECIGFSEDSLELQHVGASERCPGLAARRRSPHAASVLEFSKRVPSLGLEDVGSRGAHRVPYLSAPLWG